MTQQGNLRQHREDLAQKRGTISWEIHAIGAKCQVEQNKIREKLINCRLQAWAKIRKEKMKEVD